MQSENIQKYEKIMDDYRSGKFGNENLHLRDIFEKAGEPNLINSMSKDELMYLAEKSSGFLRGFFANLAKK